MCMMRKKGKCFDFDLCTHQSLLVMKLMMQIDILRREKGCVIKYDVLCPCSRILVRFGIFHRFINCWLAFSCWKQQYFSNGNACVIFDGYMQQFSLYFALKMTRVNLFSFETDSFSDKTFLQGEDFCQNSFFLLLKYLKKQHCNSLKRFCVALLCEISDLSHLFLFLQIKSS